MKSSKFYIILSFILLSFPSIISAQTLKYVAYFPVPYLSHNNVTVSKTAYSSVVSSSGLTTANSISTEKDLKVSFETQPTVPVSVYAGSDNNRNYDNGVFMVGGNNPTLTIKSANMALNQVNADDRLTVGSINWYKNSQNNIYQAYKVFDKERIPSDTKYLCWLPLRIRGTFNYQYYLVAWPEDGCPVCDEGNITECSF